MVNSARYDEMRRVVQILARVSDHFSGEPEVKQVVWDAIRAYTIIMQLDNPQEIYKRFSGDDVPENVKASLRRLWIGPDIEPHDDRP